MAALQGYIEEEATRRAEAVIAKRMDEMIALRMQDIDGAATPLLGSCHRRSASGRARGAHQSRA